MSDMNELARRAVACKAWRWMRGMVDQHENTVLVVAGGTPVEWVDSRGRCIDLVSDGRTGEASGLWATSLPNLTDPATMGCLEALVCDAMGSSSVVHAAPTAPAPIIHGLCDLMWHVWFSATPRHICREIGRGATKADALVTALEAAP